jgi:hypothetical protein
MSEEFSLKELNKRIEEVKQENEQSTDFSYDFLSCLMKRYDLQKCLQSDHVFEDIPERFLDILKKGSIPSKEEISKLDAATQDYFLKDCVFICGLSAIQFYCEHDSQYFNLDVNQFDEIIKMPSMSEGHQTACYIVAALALLLSGVPDQQMISAITNNFNSSEEQLDINMEYFNQLCASIMRRHTEDAIYYTRDLS